jgi:putative endonuclease
MRTKAQAAGDRAEDLVTRRLESAGWRVLGRNVRAGRAELDIVAVDPGPPPELVIVEVRWRASRRYGLAEETVDARKRGRLRVGAHRLRLAGALADGTPLPRLPLRFDLVAVEPGGVVRHHRFAA